MKIGTPEALAALNGVGTARTPSTGTGPTQKAASGDAASSAQVELSEAASALLGSPAAAASDIDSAKVERISKSIADGSYKINPEVIADKLIANAQELLGKVGK